ncbi:hypothetical protein E4656_20065 [Natronospirillum operosum]|uniref:Transposase n=1 Tax=Natronospirillum operosum TaxID=2759953 RepID=A0A4Z0W8M8_9GAMM|nr:transposase [Natronospirillum operosum]TGG89384.1 hypothetical protein E4656_20065 [Natronospirillum operosum]
MPKSNLAKKTRQYSLEFKRKTVEMTLNPEVLIKDVAERMDIHPFMLSRWRKEYREGLLRPSRRTRAVAPKKPRKPKPEQKDSAVTAESADMKKLRKENEQLKRENDLLKKWQRFLSEAHKTDTDS